MYKFYDVKNKLWDNLRKYDLLRIFRGEKRKNGLRRGRNKFFYIFIIAVICFTMSYCLTNYQYTESGRVIDYDKIDMMISDCWLNLGMLEEEDTSSMDIDKLVEHKNSIQNYKNDIELLNALKEKKLDGEDYTVILANGTSLVSMGTDSFAYKAMYNSGITGFLGILIALFCAISVSNVFGAEYFEGTAKLMLTKPAKRSVLYFAKLGVVVRDAFIYCLLGYLTMLFVIWSSIGLDFVDIFAYFGSPSIITAGEQVVGFFFNIFIAALFFVTLASMVSIMTKSKIISIIVVLMLTQIGIIPQVQDLMLQIGVSSIGTYNAIFLSSIDLNQYMAFSQNIVEGTSYTISLLVLLAYITAFVAAGLLCFKKQRAVK